MKNVKSVQHVKLYCFYSLANQTLTFSSAINPLKSEVVIPDSIFLKYTLSANNIIFYSISAGYNFCGVLGNNTSGQIILNSSIGNVDSNYYVPIQIIEYY